MTAPNRTSDPAMLLRYGGNDLITATNAQDVNNGTMQKLIAAGGQELSL